MAVLIELTAQDRTRKGGPFLVNVDSIKVIYRMNEPVQSLVKLGTPNSHDLAA
jgi:hypothetical protein